MLVLETPWFFMGNLVPTYSLRISNFNGLTKRLDLARKIKPTTTKLSFENSSFDDVLQFFRWFNHAKPEVLENSNVIVDMSPRVCDDELIDSEQNRLNSIFSLEFSGCDLNDPYLRINLDIFRFFNEVRCIKFYNCRFDEILFALMMDNFKSLTNLHTISFIGCDLDSISVEKLVSVIENNLNQIAILEIKQNQPVNHFVQQRFQQVFLLEKSKLKFLNLIGCALSFGEYNRFFNEFNSSIEEKILNANRRNISWVISHIQEFLNDNVLPFDEDFFSIFYKCRPAIFHQITSPSLGGKMLSPIDFKNLCSQMVDYLWTNFFSKYLERDHESIYLESVDLYEICMDKLKSGQTSDINNVIDDLMDITSDYVKLSDCLNQLLEAANHQKRYFAAEYLKKSIEKCNSQLEVSMAYS